MLIIFCARTHISCSQPCQFADGSRLSSLAPAAWLFRATVMPQEAGLWVGRITHDPWPLQGARLTGWRSSMLDAVPGLPGALVDPDAAPLVLYSPGVSGIRFWWGPLEEGASTVGEVPDR